MRQLSIKVAPGDIQQLAVVGDYVRVRAAAVPVRIESPDNNDFLILEVGDAVTLRRFERLLISHDSGADQAVTLIIGLGERVESTSAMKLIGGVDLNSGGEFTWGYVATAVAGAVMLLPQNLNRKFLLIVNSTALDAFYGFDNSIGTTFGTGAILKANQSVCFDVRVPTSQIWMNSAAATKYFSWVEG